MTSTSFANLWLIYIPWHFPLHMNPTITGASLEAEEAFKNQYFAVYNHLLKHKESLSNRNKAETGIRYEWYALQRWGANYMDDFSKPKMLWAETMRVHKNSTEMFPRFGLDISNSFLTDKTCFIGTGESIYYVTAILNSFLGKFLCYQYVSILDNGGFLMQKIYLEDIPIPSANSTLKSKIKQLLLEQPLKFEEKIDNLVKEIYNFTDSEINYITSSTNSISVGEKSNKL